jgi:plasmid stabilization system protein ParE
MFKRKIIWTVVANQELQEILSYWIIRNHSNRYSIHLKNLIMETLDLLREYPEMGRNTNQVNVRVKIIRDYLLFYQFDDFTLTILSIWDARRNKKRE